MNKTVIALGTMFMITAMFTGVVLIAILRPDATATIIGFTGQTLTSIVGFIILFYNVDKVVKQTNGINTALISKSTGIPEAEIERMKNETNERKK